MTRLANSCNFLDKLGSRSYLFRVPNLLYPLHRPPSAVKDRIHSVARQLRVAPVDHRAALREIFGQKVAEPDPAELASTLPRSVRVAVQTRNGDDTILGYYLVSIFVV